MLLNLLLSLFLLLLSRLPFSPGDLCGDEAETEQGLREGNDEPRAPGVSHRAHRS